VAEQAVSARLRGRPESRQGYARFDTTRTIAGGRRGAIEAGALERARSLEELAAVLESASAVASLGSPERKELARG